MFLMEKLQLEHNGVKNIKMDIYFIQEFLKHMAIVDNFQRILLMVNKR